MDEKDQLGAFSASGMYQAFTPDLGIRVFFGKRERLSFDRNNMLFYNISMTVLSFTAVILSNFTVKFFLLFLPLFLSFLYFLSFSPNIIFFGLS